MGRLIIVVKRGYSSSEILAYGGLTALFIVFAALIDWNLVSGVALGGSSLAYSLKTSVEELVTFGLFAAWIIFQRRESIRFDARREAAAAGHGAVLSLATLGMAEPASRALPTTIRVRLAWRSWFWRIMFLVFFTFMQVVAVNVTLSYKSQPGQWPGILSFLANEALAIATVLLVFWIISLAAREKFTVADEGLSVRYFGVPPVVRWQDARFSARVAEQRFEFSSPRAIVRFSLLSDERLQTSTISFQQYRAEMSAVFALIAERTGLP